MKSGKKKKSIINCLKCIGICYYDNGYFQDARELFEEALEIFEINYCLVHKEIFVLLTKIMETYAKEEKIEEE